MTYHSDEYIVLKEGTKLGNNTSYIHRFEITFEKKFVRGENISDNPPVALINIDVYANDIEEAVKIGWQTVTVTPEKFEIARVERAGRVV